MANSYGPSDEETTLCAQLANLVCALHGPLMPYLPSFAPSRSRSVRLLGAIPPKRIPPI
jgi:hypothetical protein